LTIVLLYLKLEGNIGFPSITQTLESFMRKFGLALACASGLIALSGPAIAQTRPAQAPMTIEQVKPGLYVVFGNGGNSTVRVGTDAVIVVDTKNAGDAIYAELMKNIRSVTALPVKDVFITHHHGDHSGNTVNFEQAGATVIATTGEKKALSTYKPFNGARMPADPTVTFEDKYEVDLPGAKAVAYHFDAGHTGGDAVVYFPDLKVLSAGDDVVAVTPNVDFPFGGSVTGWVKTLGEIAKLDFDTVIPGHGNATMTHDDFVAYRQKWETLLDRARAAVKAGTKKEDLLAAIKTDDLGWNINTAQWSAPARLDAFYAELSN
jgi:glyoxylase-like metal-dependent hydrolase (beta-lactamase superfamily II)